MANVFLSYVRDDEGRSRKLAGLLEREGHSVWWDRRIKGGARYAQDIEDDLAAAEFVVVLWSAASVQSAWVADEAAAGRDRGCLVPLSLDGTPPPIGFSRFSRSVTPLEVMSQMMSAVSRAGAASIAPLISTSSK